MSLTAPNIANAGKRYQRFITKIVAFDPIVWTFSFGPAAGAITWKPFCLLSPRYAITTPGGSVLISATDSYLRPTTAGAGNYCVWSKVGGVGGSVVDQGDNTAIVTTNLFADGIIKVKCVVTIGGQTADGYAYVYGGDAGNLDGLISDVDFSGNLDNGGWESTITLKGVYTDVLTNDGRNQPILIHTQMYWDGAEDNFGGYKRHQNTFVLICKQAELFQADGDYYTTLHLSTPEFVLDRMILTERKFHENAGAGYYSTADLTPTDVAYHLLRFQTNYGEEFNVSLWNNTSTITNFTVREGNSIWVAVRECHVWNFGVLWMNRWGNLNGKPAPWARYAEWTAIIGMVYDGDNGGSLPIANLISYNLIRKRRDDCWSVELQAVNPSMDILVELETVLEPEPGSGYVGQRFKIKSLICETAATLEAWALAYSSFLNNEYEIDLVLTLGHELELASEFDLPSIIPHTLGGNHDMVAGEEAVDTGHWLATDVSYQWNFGLGQWTRKVHAVKLRNWEGG